METVAEFMAGLCKLADKREFSGHLKEALRDVDYEAKLYRK